MQKRKNIYLAIITGIFVLQGCVDHTFPAPFSCSNDPVVVEIISVEDSDCALKNGRVEVLASGGTGTYLFKLADNDAQLIPVFSELAAGVYEISVTDNNNCPASATVVINNKNGLSITFQTADAGCNEFNGSIIVTPTDGVAPFNYSVDNLPFTDDSTFTSLDRGEHKVVVRDASGCEIDQMVNIKAGVSFTASISPIIETNCTVTGCHNGSQFPDFRVFKNIHDNASQIKTLTSNRTMPQEGSITQAEINIIACWVDDGAPEN
jgi:hypothetical protein